MLRRRIILTTLKALSTLLVVHLAQGASAVADTLNRPPSGREQAQPGEPEVPVSDWGVSLAGFYLGSLLGDFGVKDCTTGDRDSGCFTLTTAHEGEGEDPEALGCEGTRPCGGRPNEFHAEATVFLEAEPDPGWAVGGWSGTDDDSNTSNSNLVTMPAEDRPVVVNYEQTCFLLSRRHFPSEGGADPTAVPTQSDSCPSSGHYMAGEQIELTAAPADDWEVGRWNGTDNNASVSITNTATMPSRPRDVMVVYVESIRAFDSGFEKKGFCDWPTRFCDSCSVFSCHLSDGDASVPLNSYRTLLSGKHRGVMIGPDYADFDLVLHWWNGSKWIPVASRLSPWSSEEVIYQGVPGFYRWEVTSAAGSGTYDLLIDYPGLVKAESNRLERVRKPRKEGKRSLKAIFDKTSKHRDFLVDTQPGLGAGKTRYEASFWVMPGTDLFIKGKKHQILQLQQVRGAPKARPVVEAFMQGRNGQYSVAVRGRTDAGGKPKSPRVAVSPGIWTSIRIVWRAASDASQTDGLIELHVAGELEWSASLANSLYVVDRALLGQVSKGNKKTEGIIYFDDFRSQWGD